MRLPATTALIVAKPGVVCTCFLSDAEPDFPVPDVDQVRHSQTLPAASSTVLVDIKEHVRSLRVSYIFAMKSIAAVTLFASVVLAQSVSISSFRPANWGLWKAAESLREGID